MARYDEDTQQFMDGVSGYINSQLQIRPTAVFNKTANVGALRLYEWLNSHYQESWWDWEPETLEKTIHDDFSETVDEIMSNLLHALQVISKTNAPFESWHVFEKVGQALNENPVNFGYVQPLEMDEIAWTIKVLKTIRPQEEFEPEVRGYIAACAKHTGFVFLPEEYFPVGCQHSLLDLGNDEELKMHLQRLWPNVIQDESALGVQGTRLAQVRQYVARRSHD